MPEAVNLYFSPSGHVHAIRSHFPWPYMTDRRHPDSLSTKRGQSSDDEVIKNNEKKSKSSRKSSPCHQLSLYTPPVSLTSFVLRHAFPELIFWFHISLPQGMFMTSGFIRVTGGHRPPFTMPWDSLPTHPISAARQSTCLWPPYSFSPST